MTVQNEEQAKSAFASGLMAGAAAGLFLLILGVAVNAIGGQSPWQGLKLAGFPILGPRSLQPGFDPLAIYIGLGTHFAISIFWGVLFGLLFHGLSQGVTLLLGAAWGFVVWTVMMFIALPMIGLARVTGAPALVMSLLQQLLFGVIIAATYLPAERELPPSFFRREPHPG